MNLYNSLLDETKFQDVRYFDDEKKLGTDDVERYASGFAQIKKKLDGDRKGICILMERGADYIALVFAAWRAGYFVVPLNTAWPLEKNLSIINKIEPAAVLVGDESDFEFSNQVNVIKASELTHELVGEDVQFESLKPTDVAYVIFTSGSTGEPKGVTISVASFRSYIDWIKRRFSDYSDSERLLLTSELTFDITMGDLAFALAFGTDIGVAKYNKNIPSILAMIMKYKIDVLYSVPTTHTALTNFSKRKRGADLSSLNLILSGGDRFPWQLVDDYENLTNGAHFYNVYGPTEVTINCFSVRLDNKKYLGELEKPLPIGHCFDSLDFVLLNEDGQVGNEGELCIAGPQIMMGYYGDQKLTERSLIVDPRVNYVNRILYKTGDLAYIDDGLVYLKGRIDGLVKIRGYRIHPDEVSKVLDSLSEVASCATVAFGQQADAALAVFIKYEPGNNLTENDIKLHLHSKVPEYMMPTKIIFVDDFPLNQSGKIDKRELAKRLV